MGFVLVGIGCSISEGISKHGDSNCQIISYRGSWSSKELEVTYIGRFRKGSSSRNNIIVQLPSRDEFRCMGLLQNIVNTTSNRRM
jgi:hypothetical protein